MWLDGRLTLNQ